MDRDELLRTCVPTGKHDVDSAERALALGLPEIEPALPDLLEWLQDANWPVAHVLAPFLATIGLPLAPQLRAILAGNDEVWKYWVITLLIGQHRGLARELEPELRRIAITPTETEHHEEVDLQAVEALSTLEA